MRTIKIRKLKDGITLVSLVITIIVLLILAGVTMSTLLGDNGIIKKAQEAGDKYKDAAINEQEQLNAIGDLLEQTGIPTGEIVFTPDVTNPRNTTKTGEQNGIATGPIKVSIDYKKEKGLVREYMVVKQGQTVENATWQTVTTNPVIIDVTQNVTILARYKNIAQVPSDTTVCNIVCVDNIVPDVYNYEVANTTTNSITVEAQTQDTADAEAGPNIAGIAKYQYSKDNGVTWEEDTGNPSSTSYTFTTLTQNQGYKIAVKAIDKAGNERVATNNGTTVTTSEIAGGNDDNTGLINIVLSNSNWTNQDVTVTINWPDNIDGLTKLISTDGGTNFHTYTGAEAISQNTTIMARLKDSTGQVSNKTANLKITNIDKVGPIITAVDGSTKTDSTVTVKVTGCNDAGIGTIAGYQYNINGTWGTTESNIKEFKGLAGDTMYNIYIRAVDGLNNIGAQVGPYSIRTDIATTPYLPDSTYYYLSQTDLSTGLVCTNGVNEYVWIETPKSVTASATTTSEIETALLKYASAYVQSGYTDTWYDECGIASETEYNALKNKMLNSIKTYGGFWIGRYEAGTADNSIRTTSSQATTTNTISAQDQYIYNYITISKAQEIANRSSTSNYTSSILFGTQWNLICKYLENKGITQYSIKTDSKSIGNCAGSSFTITRGKYSADKGASYTNVLESYVKPTSYTLLTTGASERNKTMNIYDLVGNGFELTLDKFSYPGMPTVKRGSSYLTSNSMSSAVCDYAAMSGSDITFRQTLYK